MRAGAEKGGSVQDGEECSCEMDGKKDANQQGTGRVQGYMCVI